MSNNQQKISIELTKDQYFTLLKAVYLGNWMANACRDGSTENPHKEEYEEIEKFILSYANRFEFNEYVDDEDAAEGNLYPTRRFEEETGVHAILEEYDEETFWDGLIDRFGERDFYRKYSKAEIQQMTRDEYFMKLHEHIDRWTDEINESGIERLEINAK